MKKQLTMTTAMAAALMTLPSCTSNPEWNGDVVSDRDFAVCVDERGRRVEDHRCSQSSYGYSGGYGGSGGHYWYYFNRGSNVPYYGDSIGDQRFRGGSYQPSAGTGYYPAPETTNMTRSAAVSRGGLGSSGQFFGGGRS